MASEDKSADSNDWMRIAEAFAAKESTRAEDVVALVAGIRQVMSGQQAAEQAPKQITSQPQQFLPAPVTAPAQAQTPEQTQAPVASEAPPEAQAPEQAPAAAGPAATARAEQIHTEATETAPAPKKSTRGRKPAAATTATTEAAPTTKPAKAAKAPAAPKAEKASPAPLETAPSEQAEDADFSHITKAVDEGKEPAVPLDQAMTDEEVVCLECGRSMKMLKRHLGSAHGLTPEEYKYRWDLPEDFPITAPNYSASKSVYAKDMGFGVTGSKAAPKKRGRRKASAR